MNVLNLLLLASCLPGVVVSRSNSASATPTAAEPWLTDSAASDRRHLLVEQLPSNNDEGLTVTDEATQQAVDAAQQVDAAGLCKAGYKPAGKLCVCAPGFGSYVPNWANESYPTLPPPCQVQQQQQQQQQ
ncbi:hypothetical protein OEZ86_004694 [Tetradesmus obliquus]|nr:hypothetical protein OEZ86_004694 [Tetradesmus obliquus]